MQYRPLNIVTDPELRRDLQRAIAEVDREFARCVKVLPDNGNGLRYAQAIIDDVFGRVCPQRGLRLTARRDGNRMLMVDIEEPIPETVTVFASCKTQGE
jgi:hypothetical protein